MWLRGRNHSCFYHIQGISLLASPKGFDNILHAHVITRKQSIELTNLILNPITLAQGTSLGNFSVTYHQISTLIRQNPSEYPWKIHLA